MYVQHFGLKKRPFQARATGASVFVGPQIAASMAGLKKAMLASDAVASVSGPVGTGKTTLVLKALDAVAKQYQIIVIGRMRLQSNDVLELLLDELNVDNKPRGTIQKFNAFRRKLAELDASGTRLFVVVEDCARLGVDTLAEIEALTAADAGVSEGASVVLMGDESLPELLTDPQLGRIKQRTRRRLQTSPLCAAELRGYLRHCFRLAGGDFEQIFETNAPDLLHHVTDGVPRVANAVVESAMSAAAEQDSATVSSELIARVAENEFGLSSSGFEIAPAPVGAPESAAELVPEAKVEPEAEVEPETEAVTANDVPAESIAPQPEPETVFADVSEAEDLPELIQDTLPDLEILVPQPTSDLVAVEPDVTVPEPEVAAPVIEAAADVELPELEPIAAPELSVSEPQPEPEPEPQPEPETEPGPAPAPGLELELEAPEPPTADQVPAWDRDPTMAELKPDLDALEKAMAFTQASEPANSQPQASPAAKAEPADVSAIPEITLDHAISQRIESQLIDEPGVISPSQPESNITAVPAAETPAGAEATTPLPAPQKASKSDSEMEKIAAELSRAKSLEDVDDRMAETLFGEELSLAASQFITPPAVAEPVIEELNAVAQTDQVVAEPVIAEQQVSAATGTAVDLEVTLQAGQQGDENGGMDLSASQRLKTVRALNADLHPSLRDPETPAANDPPVQTNNAPDSIEDQINISMTQTMKALKIPNTDADDLDDEEEEKGKTGFFSRFKRS